MSLKRRAYVAEPGVTPKFFSHPKCKPMPAQLKWVLALAGVAGLLLYFKVVPW